MINSLDHTLLELQRYTEATRISTIIAGVVTLLTLIGLLYNVIQHAASSGINKFALADPAYALVTALAVVVAAGLVVNKLEPGIFEKDKGSKGTRKSTRVRTKRA